MKNKYLNIFLISFFLNLIWENLHSFLYAHHKNQPITEFMLLGASLFDALFITVMGVIFFKVTYFREKKWWTFIFGVIAAIIIEWYALSTGRWSYNSLMPIIPIVKTGLTPTLQLGVLSFITYYFSEKIKAQ